MFGFVASLLGDAIAPLLTAVAETGVRLLRKVALFFVAAACLTIVTAALTIAFALWIATLAGPIAAALAVAGVYLLVAVVAVALALHDDRPAVSAQPRAKASAGPATPKPELNAHIDQFTAPILDILERFGLRREQLAVFTGATLAKRLGPLPLVGCAIVVGFLVGRLWKSWRHILDAGLAMVPFAAEVFATTPPAPMSQDQPQV